MVSRFEVRLDSECRERLSELAESRGTTAAEIVRQLIDDAYEEVLGHRRLQAAEELIASNAEIPPDPEELSQLLGTAHDLCGIC
jgi:predicted DNA-binding protein